MVYTLFTLAALPTSNRWQFVTRGCTRGYWRYLELPLAFGCVAYQIIHSGVFLTGFIATHLLRILLRNRGLVTPETITLRCVGLDAQRQIG